MARKGKLVPSEKHKKSKCYGTETTRLATHSQLKFGNCCLSLEPVKDPVATPSGHMYSREAIVSYLLNKHEEIQKQKKEYEDSLASIRSRIERDEASKTHRHRTQFLQKDQSRTLSQPTHLHSKSLEEKLQRKIDTETTETKRKSLKRTNYWLTDCQPERSEEKPPPPPPERPPSPFSGDPLRLKDLIPLDLTPDPSSSSSFLCSVSGKTLTTQPVIAIKKTKKIMLRSVYEELAKPTGICPVTGKKFKEKDVIELQKAATAFAASGNVQAKRYTPTMT